MRSTVLLLVAMALAACASTNELPVEGNDSVGFGALRIKHELDLNWAVELEASKASGSDEQSVPSGFVIDVGDVVSGPADVQSDLTLTSVKGSSHMALVPGPSSNLHVPAAHVVTGSFVEDATRIENEGVLMDIEHAVRKAGDAM